MAKYVKIATFNFSAPFMKNKPDGMSTADYILNHLFSYMEKAMPDKPDLAVLPEVADIPGDMTLDEKLAYFEERGDYVMNKLGEYAKEHSMFIMYNTVRRAEDGEYHNCSTLLDREGKPIYRYDKNFPVISEMTNYGAKPGAHANVVDCELGRVGAAVCFDMNYE